METSTKFEKKWLTPALAITLLLALGGWVYNAGVLAQQVNSNTAELKIRRGSVEAVPELKNDLKEVKQDLKDVQKNVGDIQTEQAVQRQLLERIESKLE